MKAIILVNVGTPNSPGVKDVRSYLSEFLNDPRVIDIPWLLRKLLVNLIIVPFRAPKSAKLYRKLWTKSGSPLQVYSESLKQKLQKKLGKQADVYVAMRYQNPSIKRVLQQVAAKKYKTVQVVPMYPHYAESTTGTTIARVNELANKILPSTPVTFVNQFYNHPGFINAFIDRASMFDINNYDHILFSYHGLPMRQVQKAHPTVPTETCTCNKEFPPHGNKCYKATCYQTTRLLAKALQLPEKKYSTAFQSRLSKNWLEPFSDKVVENLARKGAKKVLVFAPAFVTDCLETIIEIADEYREIFKANGGQQLDLVPGLNDSEAWVEGLAGIIEK